jgi:ferrochelatase
LEEISIEGREAFLHAGGKTFNYIPCMNDEPMWIEALAAISEQHMQGWPTKLQAAQASAAVLANGRELAIALGAKQ